MVGAALLTAYKNAGGAINLRESVMEMLNRGKAVPGGTCGFWGACGAGVSAGQYMAIVTRSTPLAAEPWGLSNRMTARALEAAEVVTVRSVVALEVTVDYGLYERADLLIRAAGGKLAEPEFTDRVTLRWQMPEHTEGPLLTQLQELTRGTANVTVSAPFYAAF